MALGLGHQYCVRVIKYIYGNLGAILSFMIKEDEGREDRWFEVWPQVDTKTGTIKEYLCDYVEMNYEKTK